MRARAAEALGARHVHANLTVQRAGVAPVVRVNEPVLAAVLATIRDVAQAHRCRAAERSTASSALKGVIEVIDEDESEEDRRAGEAAVDRGLSRRRSQASPRCAGAKGQALAAVLRARLDEIAALTARAEAAPGRQPGSDQGAARRTDRGAARYLGALRSGPAASGGDPDRLQGRHPRGARPPRRACRAGAPPDRRRAARSGRKLDFLSQELNRESNTLCAKSNDVELTNIGLELKTVVEQFREQVQNLE